MAALSNTFQINHHGHVHARSMCVAHHAIMLAQVLSSMNNTKALQQISHHRETRNKDAGAQVGSYRARRSLRTLEQRIGNLQR